MIILSEVNQRQISYHLYVEYEKQLYKRTYLQNRKVYKYAKHTYGYQRRKGSGGYRLEGWD